MIYKIQLALERALQNQPGDFLISTKQEDYLAYRISSELTNNSNNSIIPTQWKRFDIVEISQVNNQILKSLFLVSLFLINLHQFLLGLDNFS